MEQRYNANRTDIHPDATSYATVINAWARSRERDAVERAEEAMERANQAHMNCPNLYPNVMTFNSMINCYAKSNLPDASDRAIRVLEEMKEKCKVEAYRECRPDVVTYTSVIDTLSKAGTLEASEIALSLLSELETEYIQTKDHTLKPNIRTYTSAINSIGRSGKVPSRAEEIVLRLEKDDDERDGSTLLDVVAYNALINAYGWSNEKGRAVKCYEILQKMVRRNQRDGGMDSRPDIVTCNSVLNACSFDRPKTDQERAEVIDKVVKTLELFQSNVPMFGYPNQDTYSHVLLALSRHMPMNDGRLDMAESAFWQVSRRRNRLLTVTSPFLTMMTIF